MAHNNRIQLKMNFMFNLIFKCVNVNMFYFFICFPILLNPIYLQSLNIILLYILRQYYRRKLNKSTLARFHGGISDTKKLHGGTKKLHNLFFNL